MYRKAVGLLLYQIIRLLPPPHAGCLRRTLGRRPVLYSLTRTVTKARATRSLRLPVLTNQITRSLRLPVLIICCVAGAVSIALSQQQSSPSPASSPAPAPAPAPVPSPYDPDAVKANSVVVSIPADDEFYFGKVRVTEADIPEKVKQALKDKPPDEQIVYVLGLIRRRRWIT